MNKRSSQSSIGEESIILQHINRYYLSKLGTSFQIAADGGVNVFIDSMQMMCKLNIQPL